MENKRYIWSDTVENTNSELWVNFYKPDAIEEFDFDNDFSNDYSLIAEIEQCDGDETWWSYSCFLLQIGRGGLEAQTLDEAKNRFIKIIQKEIESQIEALNAMKEAFL